MAAVSSQKTLISLSDVAPTWEPQNQVGKSNMDTAPKQTGASLEDPQQSEASGVFKEPYPVQGIFVYRSPNSLSIFCRRVQAAWTSLGEPKQSIFGRVQAVQGIFGRVQAVWAIFGRAEAVQHISVWKRRSGPAHLSGRAEAVQHISVWKSPSSLGHLWVSTQAVWSISVWKRAQGG